jgi:hypothetical protein
VDQPRHLRAEMIYFSDRDVVSKLAACGFLPLIATLLGKPEQNLKIRYIASLKYSLARPGKKLANKTYQRHLEKFCQSHRSIAGSTNIHREQELLSGSMDPGEAVLFAEAEETGGAVVTGDKVALKAYLRVSNSAQRSKIKVVCWEQLLLRVHKTKGYEALRAGCCEGIESDKLLSLAFSNGLATQEEHALEAFQSYLRAVEKHSSDILFNFESDP